MKFNIRIELPQWLLIAGMFVVAAATWQIVPDRIPVHWNLQGEIDRFGGKFEGLLGIPLVTLGIYLLFLFLPRIDPGYANYQKFAISYAIIRCSIVGLMGFVYGLIVLSALGQQVDINTAIPIAVGVLLIVLGNLMGKIRPNWFVGIRTPWTLSSKLSWSKTHRLGGWLFVMTGLVTVASGLIGTTWAYLGMAITLGISMIWVVVYSYRVWSKDPERVPPAGTSPNGA